MSDSSFSIRVSVLLAARNEADTILRCLEALDRLEYPASQFEVHIGDDHSTDATPVLVKQFIRNKPNFYYHRIEAQRRNLRGKANVLAQLAHEASGEILFFCDADIAVPPTWITSMLRLFRTRVGVVVGVTRMTPTGTFAGLQSLEWLFSLTSMRLFSYINIPFTGMGNNMAVTREAYGAVGGYETIGFSIVEDFLLFKSIIGHGYAFVQAFQPEVVAVSFPTPTIKDLLVQRKRWVHGATQAPWPIRLAFYASALFVPILLLLVGVYPAWCLIAAFLHYVLVTTIGGIGITLLNQKDLFKYLPLFWWYFNFNNTVMLLNYLLPTPIVWKGRTYE